MIPRIMLKKLVTYNSQYYAGPLSSGLIIGVAIQFTQIIVPLAFAT